MKVLIIEDYPGDIELVQSRLKVIGCEALVATTCDEGVVLARSEKPDLILSDLNFGAGPEEGLALVARLRSDPATAAIPLILHSVFISHAVDLTESPAKVDGFLPKPFRFVDLAQLIDRIREAQHP